MALSTQRAVSNGSMTSLALAISYLDRSEITVYFNGVLSPLGSGLWAWVGLTSNTISFSPAVANGVEVLVQRATDITEVRNAYNLGAQFNPATLDENFLQTLHAVQEAKEGTNLTEVFHDLDMHGYKLANLGAGVLPTDAATIAQVTAAAVAAGGSGNPAYNLNSNTVAVSSVVPAGYNAVSGGPMTINAGIVVTVEAGSTWTIV